MLAVKENQKNLHAEVSEYFEDEEFLKEIKNGGGYKKTQEKSHSRTETREYYQSDKIKWMEEKSRWKGLKSIGMVCKTMTEGDKTAAQNLNIINKWSLSILKLLQIGNRKLFMRKKRFYISMNAEKYLEQIIKL